MTILISFSYSLHLVEHFFTFQVALGKFFILSYLEEELLKFYFSKCHLRYLTQKNITLSVFSLSKFRKNFNVLVLGEGL